MFRRSNKIEWPRLSGSRPMLDLKSLVMRQYFLYSFPLPTFEQKTPGVFFGVSYIDLRNKPTANSIK